MDRQLSKNGKAISPSLKFPCADIDARPPWRVQNLCQRSWE